MHRFYVSQKVSSNQIEISDVEQLHHLKDVLRLKAGDEATVFDGAGNEYLVEIAEISKQKAILSVKNRKLLRIKKHKVAIACAVPKKSGMDDIIDKLTQLDVDVIIPLVTERVIVKLESKEESRLDRWRKIAINAAEQSQRNTLPIITPVMDFGEMLNTSKDYEVRLIPTLGNSKIQNSNTETRNNTPHLNPLPQGERWTRDNNQNQFDSLITVGRKLIREVISNSIPKSILAVIGPEGDFTPKEIDQAINSGFTPISLGDTTLRVETAAIAIASYIKLALQ